MQGPFSWCLARAALPLQEIPHRSQGTGANPPETADISAQSINQSNSTFIVGRSAGLPRRKFSAACQGNPLTVVDLVEGPLKRKTLASEKKFVPRRKRRTHKLEVLGKAGLPELARPISILKRTLPGFSLTKIVTLVATVSDSVDVSLKTARPGEK